MSKLALAVVIAVLVPAGLRAQDARSLFSPQQPALEINPRDDPAKRKLALSSIRASTECIAREALNEPGMPQAYGRGELGANLAGPIRRCAGPVRFMMSEQDRIYGAGSGRGFLDGPYIEDLPRAVIARIGKELERQNVEQERREAERQAEIEHAQAQRRAELERQEAERRVAAERLAAQQKAEAERQYAERQAESERREAQRKLDMERIESERRAEVLKKDEIRRQQMAVAEGVNGVLRDRMLECVGREIKDLVRSGEGAEVLATATMTICSSEIDKLIDGFVELKRIEADGAISTSERGALRVAGRSGVRDQVVAFAVKAKAAAARPTGSTY